MPDEVHQYNSYDEVHQSDSIQKIKELEEELKQVKAELAEERQQRDAMVR